MHGKHVFYHYTDDASFLLLHSYVHLNNDQRSPSNSNHTKHTHSNFIHLAFLNDLPTNTDNGNYKTWDRTRDLKAFSLAQS